MIETTSPLTATFATMVSLELQVDINFALAVHGVDANTRARGEINLKTSKARLYALLDALSLDDLRAYAAWRRGL